MTWVKPPETMPQRKPSRLQRADRGAGARGELQARPHLVEHRRGQPCEHGDPPVQRLGEVELPAHRGRGDRARPRPRPGSGAGGEHLDHLAVDQRGVDVEHDQPLAPAGRARPARPRCRRRRPRPPRRGRVRSGASAGAAWSARPPAPGRSPGSRRCAGSRRCSRRARPAPARPPERPRRDRAAEHEHDVASSDAAPRRVAVGPRPTRAPCMPRAWHRLLDGLAQAVGVAGRADERPERQLRRGSTTCSTSSTSTPCRGERGEQHAGDPGPVRPGHGDQDRAGVAARTSPCGGGHAGQASRSACVSADCRGRRAGGCAPGRRPRPASLADAPACRPTWASLPDPLDQVRVVQLERRALGADPRQLGEVVPRRRARRRPLQRVAVAPRVVDRRPTRPYR